MLFYQRIKLIYVELDRFCLDGFKTLMLRLFLNFSLYNFFAKLSEKPYVIVTKGDFLELIPRLNYQLSEHPKIYFYFKVLFSF